MAQLTPEESKALWKELDAEVARRIKARRNEYIKERDKKVLSGERTITYMPMPRIEGHPEWGPIEDTPDFIEYNTKRDAKNRKVRREKARAQTLRCMAEKHHIHRLIENLDTSKKKYSKKLAKFEMRLAHLNKIIECNCTLFGFSIKERPPKKKTIIEKALSYLSEKAKRIKKSVTKFCKKHRDTIESAAVITIPVIVAGLMKHFFGVPVDPGIPNFTGV